MDENQYRTLIRSIGISSGLIPTSIQQDRVNSFNVLEQFKHYNKVVPKKSQGQQPNDLVNAMRVAKSCLDLLSAGSHQLDNVNLTTPTKLYALSGIAEFVRTRYYVEYIQESDRTSLRASILAAARNILLGSNTASSTNPHLAAASAEQAILGSKIASLLSNMIVNDFPQRWMNLYGDVFLPGETGLWSLDAKVCMKALSYVVEDCTDSEFNAKISTSRRNDVLIGLNEISSQLLPQMFALLSDQYSTLSSCRERMGQMIEFLATQNRTIHQMTTDEQNEYNSVNSKYQAAVCLLSQCLATCERFCAYMPLDWMVCVASKTIVTPTHDFVSAYLHMLRDKEKSIHINSAACLDALSLRKLEKEAWLKFMTSLPNAIAEANNEHMKQGNNNPSMSEEDMLVEQLSFHRALSKLLSQILSSHIQYLTTDKEIMKGTGEKVQSLGTFLQLMTEMVGHPSGHLCAEQINIWTTLLRDPQISKKQWMMPFLPRVLVAYIDHMVRIRWEDIYEGTHKFSAIVEESWDGKEEYESWLCNIRSKGSLLLRLIAKTDPEQAASILNTRVQNVLTNHGNGQPGDNLNPQTKGLTQLSYANIQFEGLQQPLDNILNGLPAWSLQAETGSNNGYPVDLKRAKIRTSVRSSLSQLANSLISWIPTDAWLRHRRAAMLENLKYVWKYDATTLPQGVDSLLSYLNARNEWESPINCNEPERLSGEVIGLRKKSGLCLVSVAKYIPDLLVPGLEQLCGKAKELLSSNDLIPPNRMHLYEFLSVVATAVEDPLLRSNFVADVLSSSLNDLENDDVKVALNSPDGLIDFLGITEAKRNPASVTDPSNVKRVTHNYCQFYSALNQLLSVGKRCHEAAKKRPNCGIPLQHLQDKSLNQQNFPDEGPVSIRDLAVDDPFIPLWVRILPVLLRTLDVTLGMWHPRFQAALLGNSIQRYAYAISDDEVYISNAQNNAAGGVFGVGGTAGSVVNGWDRRDLNLVPRWSGWLNELRNTCFQLLGLLTNQRVLFAPELASSFAHLVSVVANPDHLKTMEHRHMTQYWKQFLEVLFWSCPSTLYNSHMAPIIRPVFEHMQQRLDWSWAPILESGSASNLDLVLTSRNCECVVEMTSRGDNEWLKSYYARGGLFVGDLDQVKGESVLEKVRVEITRSYCDVIQSALALKGDWALALANQAKQEQAIKKNDPSKLNCGPKTRLNDDLGVPLNADGTPRNINQASLEARQLLRINGLCHFLLLEDEVIAGTLVLTSIQCLSYPDAFTCRRCTRICHRILETVAWAERYANLIGHQLFLPAVRAIVTEPKWMVGMEWDMIGVVRDIYCRLVLGQYLLPGGQGPGLQQVPDVNNKSCFEQTKCVAKPLFGGGILCTASQFPQQVLAGLPGVNSKSINELNERLTRKRSAKDQKDALRDFMQVAAEQLKLTEEGSNGSIHGRAISEESVLNQKIRDASMPVMPEKLHTYKQFLKGEGKKISETENVLGSSRLDNLFE